MRNLLLRLLLPLLLLATASQALAQEDATKTFKMPCERVLRLGLNKFMKVWDEQTHDSSTYGMKQAFGYYAECKRADNDAHARSLTPERRRQADAAREALSKLGNAAWEMQYVAAGGGTMWALASVGAYATREEYMATVIKALAQPEKPQPLLRRRAGASVRRAQVLLARWSRTPKLEFAAKDELASQRRMYQDFVRDARAAFAQLQTLVAALPDAAAERVAKQMIDELDIGE
ncbi:MAG: hypothetical protein QOF02_2483 [Blastocatellia bacterium]|nr:hypothetical protein [Blastocatellia bacterium]